MRRSVPSSTVSPHWWPDGESWPPRTPAGAQAWSGYGRRLRRFALALFVLIVLLPLVVGVGLAAIVGGWTSVAVAVVSWAGVAVLLAIALRTGLRLWSPVRSLIDTAGRLADGDYTARADASNSAQARPVVESFNRMAARLERTEAERRRLLADVGHEIRTPLSVVRGELEAMADGVRTPDVARLGRLLGDIDVMERLLDDLATLSQAEAGMLTIHREPTEVVGLVQDIVDGLQAAATTRDITVALVASDAEIDADVDPVRLREIITNLMNNGLRATPPAGRVEATIQRRGGRLIITVADTGRGIAAADIDQVFERFHKGPGSTGSGLGLTISRNLVLAHGGDITLSSELDIGTIVTVDLPLHHDPDS